MSSVTLDLQTDMVQLPAPALPDGATLEAALKSRCSTRAFRPDAVPLESLATLLWAGCGVNRADTGRRTAPTAHDWREVTLFAVTAAGAYRYDPAAHRLMLVNAADLRGATGLQDFVASAPLNLVYTVDFARMPECRADERGFFAGADAASAAQNVSLCCAALGLATVLRALIDRRALAEALHLSPAERIALAQTVGLPTPAA